MIQILKQVGSYPNEMSFKSYLEPAVQEDHDSTGREQYRELCHRAKTIPCSYFLAHIQDSEMILRYHQFNTEDIRVITKTLAVC